MWLVVPLVYVVSGNLTVKQLKAMNERLPEYQSAGLATFEHKRHVEGRRQYVACYQ
jgi:hypothetical protein